MTPLIVQSPTAVTDAMIVGTSLAVEDPGTPWAANGAVNVGDERWRGAPVHAVFRRLSPGPANATPPELDETNWKLQRPTNLWAMFDHLRSTQTQFGAGGWIRLAPGRRVDSIGLLGVIGTSLTVKVLRAGAEVYSRTVQLLRRSVVSWYQFYTRPFDQQQAIVLWDLPPFAGAQILVEVTPLSGVASIGKLAIGMQVEVGEIQTEAVDDAANYSKVQREFDGSLIPAVTLIPRRSVPKGAWTVQIKPENVNNVRRLRDQLNAVPAIYCGLADLPDHEFYDATLYFGIYRQWPITLRSGEPAVSNIQVEEV